jgi:glutamate-1-semialdehyde aminotransferase
MGTMDADRYAGSAAHMDRARRVLTRGVGSAMREAQLPTPLAIAKASGSRLVDVDGNASASAAPRPATACSRT